MASPKGSTASALGQFYGQLSFKNFTFTGAYGRRRRDVPTASFGTVFNEQQSREQTTDRHTLADVEYYGRSFGASHVTVAWLVRSLLVRRHLSVRRGQSHGTILVARNSVLGTRWTRRRSADARRCPAGRC